ncbi:transcription factor S-II-domain-containing protein [Halenospora varia]|nr:transcription factor S-II-domain-containing protein [Halenospora varia]
MSAIGSLVFCTDCGNLLDSSTGNKNTVLLCDCCGAENKDTASKTITTTTKASSFPSVLRQKRSAVQTVERGDMENTVMIQETCPECGRKEVRFTSVQLRSADEGSTIFYTCDCGHKWNTNN